MDGDGSPEIVSGGEDSSGRSVLHVWRPNGTSLPNWPKVSSFFGSSYFGYGPPTLADLDGAGTLERPVAPQPGAPACARPRPGARLGYQDVSSVHRRSRAEMRATPAEIRAAEEEGVKLVLLAGPSKVVADGGKATGLECVKMALGEPDESGRRRPVPQADSGFVIEADLVIAAVGETPELEFMDQAAVKNGLVGA